MISRLSGRNVRPIERAVGVALGLGVRFGALVAGLCGALREPEPLDPVAAARLAKR